ncbi:carbohydrate kinase family protein [Pararhodospirillum photometricum]|uniref:carbohydrate kinase family protein n=1 Tax=Pararhodospirillum photometricum TaxID=1084 RepID=UPI0024126138|nr:carbohydrate kinase family protein [Pararhodospirillum photometricum]
MRPWKKSCATPTSSYPAGPSCSCWPGPPTKTRPLPRCWPGAARPSSSKKGAGGAWYFAPSQRFHHPAFAVQETDPTGAGDCFGATFVTAWLRGLPPEEALGLACAAGALAVTRKGPMEGTSSLGEIAALRAAACGGLGEETRDVGDTADQSSPHTQP